MNDQVTPELYRQIFEVDQRGAAIFEHLVKLFSKPAQLQGGIDAVLTTYHRQGQQAVIQHIVRQCNIANGLNDSPTPEQPE